MRTMLAAALALGIAWVPAAWAQLRERWDAEWAAVDAWLPTVTDRFVAKTALEADPSAGLVVSTGLSVR